MWSKKSLRPDCNNPLFSHEDPSYTVSTPTPMQMQREKDNSPHTFSRPGLAPPDIRKSSMAEDLPYLQKPQVDPEVYSEESVAKLIKSYLQSK